MSSSDHKLDQILERLDRIEKALKIVPDRDVSITDNLTSLEDYTRYARESLGLEQITIENQRSAIMSFLDHSKGKINPETVRAYLDSNESSTWKTNQIKALRRYIRDFLKLGNWMEEFKFKKERTRIQKAYPTNEDLADFGNILSDEVQLVFLVLLSSGLRIGEILGLKIKDLNLELNMIDASSIHTGKTKSSRFSFMTEQASELLLEYLDECKLEDPDLHIFSISARTIQQDFKNASEQLGLDINPKLLRKVFADRCEKAGIEPKYIDAFCGRTPNSVLDKHYTDYSPESMRQKYDKVEKLLTLPM